jgi:hypothetical protein
MARMAIVLQSFFRLVILSRRLTDRMTVATLYKILNRVAGSPGTGI